MQSSPSTGNTVTSEEANARMDDILARTKQGEQWTIIDAAGRPLAKLGPAPTTPEGQVLQAKREALFGCLEGLIEFLPGWDDPLEEFDPYR